MTIYLALQSTYAAIQVGLFHENTIIDSISIDKFKASQELIPTLNKLLNAHNYNLSDLSFIAVNQGPAPFTTLRVTIATANGIAFASTTPLIGIDALHTLLTFHAGKNATVVLLNAFNHDVYAAIKHNNSIETGCFKAAPFLHRLAEKIDSPIEFLGNAVPLYESIIQELFKENVTIAYPIVDYTTLEQIAHAALLRWQKKERVTHQLFPLYLKSAAPV